MRPTTTPVSLLKRLVVVVALLSMGAAAQSNISLLKKIKDARNPKTTPEILRILATDKHAMVRWGVAANGKTPTTILEDLAQDSDWRVRSALSRNPRAPKSLLEWDTQKPLADRMRAAKNPNTPLAVTEYLVRDNDWTVRKEAQKHPKALDVMESQLSWPQNPSSEILEALSRDDEWCVQLWVAFNPLSPSSALETLSHIDDPGILSMVAGHTNTPTRILKKLVNSKYSMVREISQKNLAQRD